LKPKARTERAAHLAHRSAGPFALEVGHVDDAVAHGEDATGAECVGVAVRPTVRAVKRTEVKLGAAPAAFHLEAIQSGMALGELDRIIRPSSGGVIESRSRHWTGANVSCSSPRRASRWSAWRRSSSALLQTPTIGPNDLTDLTGSDPVEASREFAAA
jgi:hypothetical protein